LAIHGFDPDLVFPMDGFAVLEAVPSRRFRVVFLTAHHHHALHAFEAEALDYLLEAVDPECFEGVLKRARQQVARRSVSVMRRFLKRLVAQKNGRETYPTRGTLARQFDADQLARISRSAPIDLDSVKEMQPWCHGERRTILKDGTELTWTRRFRAASSRE
jgi:two-component system LytT family response regulator